VDAFLKKHASHCWDFSKIKYMFLGKIMLVNYVILGIVLPLKSGFEIAFSSFCKENILKVCTQIRQVEISFTIYFITF
jgi:hypothetical protein